MALDCPGRLAKRGPWGALGARGPRGPGLPQGALFQAYIHTPDRPPGAAVMLLWILTDMGTMPFLV